LDELKRLISPLNIGNVYTDGNYAYFERFENVIVSKKNTQKNLDSLRGKKVGLLY